MRFLLEAVDGKVGIEIVGGSVDGMALGGGRSPWIGELGSVGVRHVVEVHAAEALLIVDGHSHLLKMIDVEEWILQEESQ